MMRTTSPTACLDDRRCPAHRAIKTALAIICFTLGGMIYLLWRDRGLVGHRLLEAMGLRGLITQARHLTGHVDLPEWILYSLPDSLWATAYILAIDALPAATRRGPRLLWAAVIPGLGCLSEALQAVHLMPGTWDPADLASYGAPYACYALCQWTLHRS